MSVLYQIFKIMDVLLRQIVFKSDENSTRVKSKQKLNHTYESPIDTITIHLLRIVDIFIHSRMSE